MTAPLRDWLGRVIGTGGTEVATDVEVRGRAKAADGIFASVLGSLDVGGSATVSVLGDSTGNATDEWVYLTAQRLAGRYPSAHVKYKLWNDTVQAYAPWIVIQAGAGERHALFGVNARSMYLPAAAIPAVTGDQDIRVRVALDNWQRGATQTLAAHYVGTANHSWKLEVNSSNFLTFSWSADGATDIAKTWTTAVPWTAGQEVWIRVTLDVDNGATQNVWTIYYSTDGGTTWVQGATSTTAGVTSVYNNTAEYEIGGRGQAGGIMAGRIFEVQIRDGIDGRIVNPQPVDSWSPRGASGSYVPGTFGGSPTLYVTNGSHPGAGLTYLADAVRLPKMLPPTPGALIFQSCSHNDGDGTGPVYLTARKAWQDAIDARCPGSQSVLVTQNPQQAPMEASAISNHARRRQLLTAWAARNSLAVVDTYRAFLDDPRGLTALLLGDGLHPSPAGSQVWADAVARAVDAA